MQILVFHYWMTVGALKAHPWRWLISAAAIATGVALAFCIHLIHRQALEQFESGVRRFSGQADLVLQPHSETLPTSTLREVAKLPGLEAFSPVVQAQVYLPALGARVTWTGLDVFRAARVTPLLIGQPFEGASDLPQLASGSVFASPALVKKLNLPLDKPSTIATLQNDAELVWTINGLLTSAADDELLVVSDIAPAQWHFLSVDKLTKVDLKLKQGVSVEQFVSQAQPFFSEVGRLETPSEQTSRGASVSQAYRANLSILAMVALLTGGFLSFSTQMLSVAQRSRQWALLASIGSSSRTLGRQILLEASVSGVIGGLAGLWGGFWLAQMIIQTQGVDLGAGYFEVTEGALQWRASEAWIFGGLGVIASLLGSWLPHGQAQRIALGHRLRSGTEESGLQFIGKSHVTGLFLLAFAVMFVWVPPIGQIAVGGYIAIACGLFGGICLTGWVAKKVLPSTGKFDSLPDLAINRLANTPNLLAVGLSGVVASFSLVVAMHVMITSFRDSLDNWLTDVLPAPAYLSLRDDSPYTGLPEQFMTDLKALPALGRVDFLRSTSWILDPYRPAVELLIRPIDASTADRLLPMTGAWNPNPAPESVPVWVSEPAARLYGYQLGQPIQLTNGQNEGLDLVVAGIWRDYARQHGAMVLPESALSSIGFLGDLRITQASLWPESDEELETMLRQVIDLIEQSGLSKSITQTQSSEVRQISLQIFDRSFAVTYLLELAAVCIGLFGVATTFSAMAIQRQQEFALMKAMGGSDRVLMQLIFQEGLLSSWIGALLGLVMGLAFAAVLIEVVNPQSFNWTMDWHIPYFDLLSMVLTLLGLSTLTMLIAVRRVLRNSQIRQLKEDWF